MARSRATEYTGEDEQLQDGEHEGEQGPESTGGDDGRSMSTEPYTDPFDDLLWVGAMEYEGKFSRTANMLRGTMPPLRSVENHDVSSFLPVCRRVLL
ncbi:hypothetical protein PHISP_03784 [Aspergillus sp. HF37]|nr:hypothetical protein PHISP_03784 [Aspergillus sp. HF37]